MRRALLVLSALLAGCASAAPPPDTTAEVDLARFFAGAQPVDATFVLLDGGSGRLVRYNPSRAARRFLPASTFKIPNSLIALETGVAPDADLTIAYDSARHRRSGFWTAAWEHDHTLESAFRNSVYWYFQEIARRIGERRMAEHLARFDYGNRSMGGGLDRFWLEGDLRISADEQVRFLERFYEGELGLSERTTDLVKRIMALDQGSGWLLGGKTGTADVTPTRELAWLVGFVEHDRGAWHLYALNMEGEEVWERWGQPDARLALVRDILRELGALP